jgi:hypothetical protein
MTSLTWQVRVATKKDRALLARFSCASKVPWEREVETESLSIPRGLVARGRYPAWTTSFSRFREAGGLNARAAPRLRAAVRRTNGILELPVRDDRVSWLE